MSCTEDFYTDWPALQKLHGIDDAHDQHDIVLYKIVAMLVLFSGSLVAGFLPIFFTQRYRERFPLITSFFICFGAGVLMATALVYIMQSVRRHIDPNWTEITLGAGFFLTYFIDELIKLWFSLQQPNNSENERARILIPDNVEAQQPTNNRGFSFAKVGEIGLNVTLILQYFIEGFFIGAQNSTPKVLLLFGAIACHIFVLAFSLGLAFCGSTQEQLKVHMKGIFLFALGPAVGIIFGLYLMKEPDLFSKTTWYVIRGIGAGTLVYVSLGQIIPIQRSEYEFNASVFTGAGCVQFLSMSSGFLIMTIITFWVNYILKCDKKNF